MKHAAGFTLIEIAIVLVIIGLILGGVLRGQEMIANGRIKRIVNDMDGISAAIYAYQDRYRALPGDDPGANARWGVNGGNGDGRIGGMWNAEATANDTDESNTFWLHLRRAGLIPGPTGANNAAANAQPINAYGGRIGMDATNNGLVGTVLCMDMITGKAAAIIDQQLDDGISDAGAVRVNESGNYNGPSATPNAYTAANEDTIMTLCRRL